jgi:hypothetical protein
MDRLKLDYEDLNKKKAALKEKNGDESPDIPKSMQQNC